MTVGQMRAAPRPPLSRGPRGVAISVVLFGLLACGAGSSSLPGLGCCGTRAAEAWANAKAIKADVAFLASDRLEGRGTGTPGNDSAAAYIARRFASLRLHPGFAAYQQSFLARPLAAAHS